MGQYPRPDPQSRPLTDASYRRDALLCHLLSEGLVTDEQAERVGAIVQRRGLPTAEVLRTVLGMSQGVIARAQATLYQAQLVNPQLQPPDPRLLQLTDPTELRGGLFLPWRQMGAATVVLTTEPENFHIYQDLLKDRYGRVRMAITTPDSLAAAISEGLGPALITDAECRVSRRESCRGWNARKGLWLLIEIFAVAAIGVALAPGAMIALLCGLSILTLACQTGLKIAALIAVWRHPVMPPDDSVLPARLPTITMLIPLFRENAIAAHLLERLRALDYPAELLDICFVMEEDDRSTREAMSRARLSPWMRAVSVPAGNLQTKPRALNYALHFARGSIVGVWDAEDAPAPDQLHVVARRFASADGKLACLQGTLDYYNPGANWLTRCFTIEYASWFRLVLPGLARLGLVVPLGGTTLFFRRNLLEKLGAWDAHNVTEDADLGVRLARHGFRTEFIATVTEEEANGHVWSWVRQRSRWLKGYAMTYGVHMRDPLRLWRDLGTWRVFGFQVLFLGTLLQFLLAPVIWSFWVVPFGIPHPFMVALPPALVYGTIGLFVLTEAVNLLIGALGVRKAGKNWLIPWVPSLHLYFPLAALAAWKGIVELGWRPFFWDKTSHGLLLPAKTSTAIPPPRPRLRQVSNE